MTYRVVVFHPGLNVGGPGLFLLCRVAALCRGLSVGRCRDRGAAGCHGRVAADCHGRGAVGHLCQNLRTSAEPVEEPRQRLQPRCLCV